MDKLIINITDLNSPRLDIADIRSEIYSVLKDIYDSVDYVDFCCADLDKQCFKEFVIYFDSPIHSFHLIDCVLEVSKSLLLKHFYTPILNQIRIE